MKKVYIWVSYPYQLRTMAIIQVLRKPECALSVLIAYPCKHDF
jgi:hypothetical protein